MDLILLERFGNKAQVIEIGNSLNIIIRWIKTRNDKSLLEELASRVTEFENSLIRWIKTQTYNQQIQDLREIKYKADKDDEKKMKIRSQRKTTKKISGHKQKFRLKRQLQPQLDESTVQTLPSIFPQRSENASFSSPEIFDEIHTESDIPISEEIEVNSPVNVNVNEDSEENLDLDISQQVDLKIFSNEIFNLDDMIEPQMIKSDPAAEMELDSDNSVVVANNSDEAAAQSCQSSSESESDGDAEVFTRENSSAKYKPRPPADPQECKLCNKIYANYKSLWRHRKRVHKNSIYRCKTCKEIFNSTTEVITHRQSIHKRLPVLPRKCPICDKLFKTKNTLTNHLNNVHPSVGKREEFVCDTCGKVIKNGWIAYQYHKRIYHNPNKPIFTCEMCNKVFSTNTVLIRHWKSFHAESKEFICVKCGKEFGRNDILRSHEKKVHGVIHG